jgi:hypothetical protein
MAHIVVGERAAQIDLSLTDELLSLHGRFVVPYEHIRAAGADPVPPALWRGMRIGTNLPGVKVAGTFIGADGMTYYDFHDPQRCLTLELTHDRYTRVVVEADADEDPHALAQAIAKRIGG